MRAACLSIALFALAGGCDGAGDPSDAAARDVLAPDLGPPPSCLELCATYRQHCGQALLLQGCEGCSALVAAAEDDDSAGNYARAVALCHRASAGRDCKGMAACLADEDGLTGVAPVVQVSITGAAYEIDFDLVDEAAVAVVGTKNSGRPSDLLVYFTVDDAFYVLEIDDLGADAEDGPLQAEDHRVTLDSVGDALELASGTIAIEAFALPGPLRVTADLRPADRPEDHIGLTLVGEF